MEKTLLAQISCCGHSALKIFLLSLLSHLSNYSLGQIQLVSDVNSQSYGGISEFGDAREVNGIVFFPGDNGLWRTDGTQGGSTEIKKFKGLYRLVGYKNEVFFVADDGVHGYELWKSNGTSEGTKLVKDIAPGESSSSANSFVIANNLLFFIATTPKNGKEVWRTDGTAEGTFLLRDIIRGPSPSNPNYLVAFKNRLFFSASDGIVGYELWSSDGSSSGTNLFKDVRAGKPSSTPQSLIVSGANLFFNAYTDAYGREVWKTDGTAAGTGLVKAIRPGVNARAPEYMMDVKGTLFFRFDDGTGSAFWRSDGTSAGTRRAFEVPGVSGEWDFFHGAVTANGKIYIHINAELYESDGTQEGTKFLVNAGDYYSGLRTFVHNDIFYFIESEILYYDDDAMGSTHRISKIENSQYSIIAFLRGAEWAPSLSFTPSLGMLFSFTADDHNVKLWKSEGNTVVPFLDIVDHTKGSKPASLVEVAGNILFVANDSANVRSLWKMDGRSLQTGLIHRIEPFNMTRSGIRVYFLTSEGHLWKSNGTTAGTMLVKKFPGGTNAPQNLTDVNGTVFFSAVDGAGNRELWKSTGNYAGTVRVKDINPGSASSDPSSLVNFNGTLFFSAIHPSYGHNLWKSDGTSAGTTIVLPADEHYFFSPRNLVPVGNTLFFLGSNWSNGVELYKTDGTSAGTVLVKDLRGNDNSRSDIFYGNDDIAKLKAGGERLYFTAMADDGTWDLWTSNGTDAGTYMLLDLDSYDEVKLLEMYKGRMFFTLNGFNTSVPSLWSTDGTPAGTAMVKQLPSPDGASKSVVLDNILYFEGAPNNLWRTDGTACGTFMVPTLDGTLLGLAESPQMIINKDRRIVFAAFSPYTGTELFRLEKANAPRSSCVTASDKGVVEVLDGDPFERDVESYPNPFVNHFTLRVNTLYDQSYDVSVMSASGAKVTSWNDLKTNTDYAVGQELQNGIYLVKISLGNRTKIRRVVKVN